MTRTGTCGFAGSFLQLVGSTVLLKYVVTSLRVRKFKNQGFTKRIPFTGKNALPEGAKPKGKLGVDYIAIQRYDGKIQYYIKPKK